MINVGRISYINTAPFFHFWPSDGFRIIPGVPRELAQDAAAGKIDASPLPLVECWKLENDFDFLNKWGIASRERSGSVFLLSRRPFAELQGATIGVTPHTSTSIMLCELLLRKRYGLDVTMQRGLNKGDDAWLVIGDQALGLRLEGIRGNPWTHITDLATEWWRWQGKPFVFARWVARKSISAGDHGRLEWIVGEALDRGLANLSEVALVAGSRAGFPSELVERYLSEFMYEIDAEAEESMRIFRRLLDEADILPMAARA